MLLISICAALIGIGAWVGKMNSDMSTVKDFIKEIRDDIKEIFKCLPPVTATSKSPIQLTDLGEEVADEIAVETWAHELKQKINTELEGKPDPYEVQEICFQYAEKHLFDAIKEFDEDDALAKKIKGSAYNHGLELDQVLMVVGIVLRDKALADLDLEL